MTKKEFHPEIVQKYDIRGIYGSTLCDEDAYLLGRCLVGYYKDLFIEPLTFSIGQDCRESGPILKKALIQGIADAGGNAIDLGLAPTPVANLLTTLSISKPVPITAGIVITASHNPAAYNGFKVTDQTGLPLFGDKLKSLPAHCSPIADQKGVPLPLPISEPSLEDWYTSTLLSYFPEGFSKLSAQTIVWDLGNGVGGNTLNALIQKLPGTHILLNETPDPSFPDHTPDPSIEENTTSLKQAVLYHQADLGFSIDMDGDRLAVIDSKGRYWNGDLLSYMFCEDLCERQKSSHFLLDIKSSQSILDHIQELGGTHELVPTGHALIKSLLKKNPNAVFAGEYSGHFYFPKDYGLVDDAFYTALKVCQLHLKTPLASRFETIKKYPSQPQKMIHFKTHEQKNEAMAKILDTVSKKNIPALLIDGVRATYKEGWWLIRSSNTEPVLTYRCEGMSLDALEKMEEDLLSLLKECEIN